MRRLALASAVILSPGCTPTDHPGPAPVVQRVAYTAVPMSAVPAIHSPTVDHGGPATGDPTDPTPQYPMDTPSGPIGRVTPLAHRENPKDRGQQGNRATFPGGFQP